MKHYATCTRVHWSDREALVNLSDDEDVVGIVLNCSLDHYYDRTVDGIPCGIPDETAEILAPVVASCLSAIEPDWQNKTVWPTAEQRENMRQNLLSVLRRREG